MRRLVHLHPRNDGDRHARYNPAPGAAFSASASATPPQGDYTVCAFLDDDEGRQFATDTDSAISNGGGSSGAPTSAGGCTKLAHLPTAKKRKIAKGGLIYSARVARKKGHATLLISTRTAAIVTARGRHHVKPCKLLAVRLKGKHGRLRLAASIRRGSERRTIKY